MSKIHATIINRYGNLATMCKSWHGIGNQNYSTLWNPAPVTCKNCLRAMDKTSKPLTHSQRMKRDYGDFWYMSSPKVRHAGYFCDCDSYYCGCDEDMIWARELPLFRNVIIREKIEDLKQMLTD